MSNPTKSQLQPEPATIVLPFRPSTTMPSTSTLEPTRPKRTITNPLFRRGLILFRWQLQLQNRHADPADPVREELMYTVADPDSVDPAPPTTLGMMLEKILNEYLKEYIAAVDAAGGGEEEEKEKQEIRALKWSEKLKEKGVEFETEETRKAVEQVTGRVLGDAGVEVVFGM